MFKRNTCQPSRGRRRGFSLVELLIVIAIIMIIAGIAIPQYNKAMMSARETAATRTMQTIHAMETQYYSQFGRYAATLAELGPPASGTASPAAADLISKDLATGKNNGYTFTVQATPTGYSISAVPEIFNNSGRRSFYSDQSLQMHTSWTQEPANVNSPER